MKKSIVLTIGVLGVFALAGCSDDSGSSGGSESAGGASGATSSATGGTESGTGGSGDSSTGGSTNTGAPDISGIPQDEPLDALTAAEQQSLCEAANARITDAVDVAAMDCTAIAMQAAIPAVMTTADPTDEALQTACSDAFDPCVENYEPEPSDCAEPLTGDCTATYEEVAACMDAQAQAINEMMAELPSCDELTIALIMSGEAPTPPADSQECITVQEKCPGLLE